VIAVEKTSMVDVVNRCNKRSQNLFAEALLKRMGRQVTGSEGSWVSGAAALRIFLKKQLGAEASIVRISDGSGLSRNNRVTAALLTDLLRGVAADDDLGDVFVDSLAIGGVDGSLRKRLRSHDHLKGRVIAKSGYINGVVTLSGYLIVTRDAKPLDGRAPASTLLDEEHVVAFSILVNDVKPPKLPSQVRAFQDYLLHVIDRGVRRSLPAEEPKRVRPVPLPLGG